MTRKQVIEAIEARKQGEWDNLSLLLVGPLLADTNADIEYIRSLEVL